LAAGLLAAILASPLLRSLLFHVNPINVAMLATVTATVGIAEFALALARPVALPVSIRCGRYAPLGRSRLS
jgi:hypothetical protein